MTRTPNVDQTLISIIDQAEDLRALARNYIKNNGDQDAAFNVLFEIDRQIDDLITYLQERTDQ